MTITALELAREIVAQCAEYDEIGRGCSGVTLSELNPDDGLIHSIADQLDEYKMGDR